MDMESTIEIPMQTNTQTNTKQSQHTAILTHSDDDQEDQVEQFKSTK